MTDERRKEIALKVIEAKFCQGGIPSKRELNQDLRRASEATGIPLGELMEFYESFLPAILTGIFDKPSSEIFKDFAGPK